MNGLENKLGDFRVLSSLWSIGPVHLDSLLILTIEQTRPLRTTRKDKINEDRE